MAKRLSLKVRVIKFASPARFMVCSGQVLPWMIGLTLVVFAIGFYLIWRAPNDYLQGETVRIMYIHVPSAWLSLLCYTVMACASVFVILWRWPLAEIMVKSAVALGMTFTAITLVTGALWGKPTWGTYWQWDARMTSELVLLLLYLGLLVIWAIPNNLSRVARGAAILTIVGFINIPIIKFSVEWWHTLHQGASVFRLDGPTIDPSILTPLLVMTLAFSLLFITLHLKAMRNEILNRHRWQLMDEARNVTPKDDGYNDINQQGRI